MKVLTWCPPRGLDVIKGKIYTVSDTDNVSGYIVDETGKEVYITFNDWWVVDPISTETVIKLIQLLESLREHGETL